MKVSKLQKILGATTLVGLTTLVLTCINKENMSQDVYALLGLTSFFSASFAGLAYGILKETIPWYERDYWETKDLFSSGDYSIRKTNKEE